MLEGCDISHWNNNNVIENYYDFVICKASEGTSYKDRTFQEKLNICKEKGVNLVGAYHYAKTNQDVTANVNNFISSISNREELGKSMLLALDIEGEDINRPNTWSWCLEWCKQVYAITGIRPLVYTSASYTKYMKDLYENNFGLWVAHWNINKPMVKTYPFYAIWQYTNRPIDLDFFNGTKEQFLKYCTKEGEKIK